MSLPLLTVPQIVDIARRDPILYECLLGIVQAAGAELSTLVSRVEALEEVTPEAPAPATPSGASTLLNSTVTATQTVTFAGGIGSGVSFSSVTYTLAANSVALGDVLRVRISGYYTAVDARVLLVGMNFGINYAGQASCKVSAGPYEAWCFEWVGTVTQIGASAACRVNGGALHVPGTGSVQIYLSCLWNSTVAQAFLPYCQLTTAASGDSVTVNSIQVSLETPRAKN